jgi:hypothetical protein
MRRVLLPAGVLAVALLGCTRAPAGASSDASTSAFPETTASSPAADSASAPPDTVAPPLPTIPTTRVFPGAPSVTPLPPPGAHVAGNSCTPGRDSLACTNDGNEVLTCAGGQWRMLQACHGPGKCVGLGSSLECDTGAPQPGDSCAPATSQPHCRSAHEAIACVGGKWMVSPCAEGKLCSPGAGKGHAGCK